MNQPGRLPVLDRRRAGVLLHLGSLSQAGSGPMGAGALHFIDWLAQAGFTVWQILPLGPTGPDGSPYWARSDHAGNPALLDRATAAPDDAAVAQFAHASAAWLEDYALFAAIGAAHAGAPWWEWPAGLRDRSSCALELARTELASSLQQIRREQCQFEQQWRRLREHARARGVRLFGDLPIYVAPDSVTTWVHRSQFQLLEDGRPAAVAGVPPDYFSADGQLWGNPLYDWERMRQEGFGFWRERLRAQLARYDLVRIDHFRALAAYWAVPAGAPTARGGEWRAAPGREMLLAAAQEFPDLPFVAEDLGLITPDVDALRRQFKLPGMRVLQFAFDGDAANPHLPFNHERDCVVYSGTHDNDTTLGWYRSLDTVTRGKVEDYLRASGTGLVPALVRETLASVGQLAILPAQDLLALATDARLNMPGTVSGNWSWQLREGLLTPELARHHAHLNQLYGRF